MNGLMTISMHQLMVVFGEVCRNLISIGSELCGAVRGLLMHGSVGQLAA